MNKSILKFFWWHIKPYKWHYLVMLLAPIVMSFYTPLYNYTIKLFINDMVAIEHISYSCLIKPIILFFIIQVVPDLVWRISNVAEWLSEPYVRRSILLRSYDYVQNHCYQFFQDNFSGAISSKLKGILDGYDKFWENMHHGLFLKGMRSIVGLVALAIVNFQLGLFVVLWVIVYMPIMYKMSKNINQFSFKYSESRHSLIGMVSDCITNIITIFAFATGKKELHNLEQQINNHYIPSQINLYKYNFKFQIIGFILYMIMLIFIPFYMIHLKINGLITIGDFAFVFGVLLCLMGDLWETTISFQDFALNMGDLKSALSILQTPQQNLDSINAKELLITGQKIEFNNVSFSYNNQTNIFNNLNLIINPGEKIGLVGHSGSGKSSLVNLLLRYFKYNNGAILIDGQDINNVTAESLRKNIAIIPQDTLLFHRSLMENIRYGNLNATDEEVIAVCKKARMHDFINTLPLKYNTEVGERGIKLSGGQRQRIAIARAILKDAPILILDEATSSLDSHTEQLIQESLNFLIDDQKKTVIAVAHRLSTLKHMDRIIVLDQGIIVEQGIHDELIANEKSLYKKLWELQEI